MVRAILFAGFMLILEKPLPFFSGYSSRLIPKNAMHPLFHLGQVSNKNLPWSQRFSLILLREREQRKPQPRSGEHKWRK